LIVLGLFGLEHLGDLHENIAGVVELVVEVNVDLIGLSYENLLLNGTLVVIEDLLELTFELFDDDVFLIDFILENENVLRSLLKILAILNDAVLKILLDFEDLDD
jgi:hypothetical protein